MLNLLDQGIKTFSHISDYGSLLLTAPESTTSLLHNVGFDFALAFSWRPEGRGELVSLVKKQIGIANRLMTLGDEEHKNKIYEFEMLVETHELNPPISILPLT